MGAELSAIDLKGLGIPINVWVVAFKPRCAKDNVRIGYVLGQNCKLPSVRMCLHRVAAGRVPSERAATCEKKTSIISDEV